MIYNGYTEECAKWLHEHNGKMTKDAPLEIRRNYYDNYWRSDVECDNPISEMVDDNPKLVEIQKQYRELEKFLQDKNIKGYVVYNKDELISGIMAIARAEQKKAYKEAKEKFSEFFAQ